MNHFLISKDSILNNLPSKEIESRHLTYFDAIIHTIEMVEIIYGRLVDLLARHKQPNNEKDSRFLEHAMIDTWGIVDCFYRLRQVLSSSSGIKKNTPWFQKFFRQLSVVEDVRHFLQHYNEKIPLMEKTNSPIVGHVCWLNVKSSKIVEVILIQPGRIKTGSLPCINPTDKPISSKIDHVTFFLGDLRVDLSDLVNGLKEFVRALETFLNERYGEKTGS